MLAIDPAVHFISGGTHNPSLEQSGAATYPRHYIDKTAGSICIQPLRGFVTGQAKMSTIPPSIVRDIFSTSPSISETRLRFSRHTFGRLFLHWI